MEISLFGETFAAPIFVAPIGLIPYTYTEDMTDRLYCDAVMLGAKAAGILAFGGGGPKAENFYEPLEAIRENGSWGTALAVMLAENGGGAARDCRGNRFAVYRKGYYDGGSGAEGGQSRCICDCGFQPWRQSDGSWAFDSRGAA